MGKGSKLVTGGSWMSKHARNLLQDMPIDNRASGKGPGKHHPDGPMKHGMMHDGPGEYGKMKGPGKHGKPHPEIKITPSAGENFMKKAKERIEFSKKLGPGKHGVHGPMAPGDTKKKSTDLNNVDVKAPKNVTINKGFITNPSGRAATLTKEGHKITTKFDMSKYRLENGKRKKGKIISQTYPVYDRS
jgi:hypothetical protein|tara:strand:- start:127 stop:690 length:564 start_codon:yes stop_codon:yes gene_type:complete